MKIILYILGIVAILSGVIGFFGNNTVLGLYDANTNQNIVHIILGLVLLISIMKHKEMLTKIIGIVFAIVGVLGFIMSGDTVLGLAVDSTATNLLHLLLGVVILIIVFMNKSGSSNSGGYQAPAQPQMPQQEDSSQQPHNTQM
jgi:predicted anti-sigma-YlaC factor YlaD